ncbi:MAG: zf-HC2 domain-containing protein [Acidobacteriota bacterium]|nr:zf-HC2 domain-containing protein [Acidobacteriota bacterium]
MCDSPELLVSFLYDELTGPERQAFRAHLDSCANCREEVAGLRSTRRHLASWAPPDPGLGFHIVRNAPAPQPASRARVSPLWGLAAAAVLVLAAGSAIANVEVRYGSEGLLLRTGWNGVAPEASTARPGPAASSQVDWKREAEALELRVRQLESGAVTARAAGAPVAAGVAGADLLRRVGEMVDQSESRQERALAVRIAALTRDLDARRKVDLAVIDQGLMRLQTTNGAEIRQSRDLMQRMYRATAFQAK